MSVPFERIVCYRDHLDPVEGYRFIELDVPGIRMLGRYEHHAAQPALVSHLHENQFEISLMIKGRQSYRVAGRTYQMKGGDQFITLPNEIHDSAEEVQEIGMLYWMIFDGELVNDEWLGMKPADAKEVIEQLRKLPCRHFRADPTSHLTLDRVFKLLDRPPSRLRDLEIETLLQHYLFQTIDAAQSNAVPELSPQIQSAIEAIARCEDEKWIDLAVLAKHAGWSEPHFKARFRQEMGMPPAEYMVRRKVDLAKRQLLLPGAHIAEVASNLGFSSSQYFATVFKRYARQTPSEFVATATSKSQEHADFAQTPIRFNKSGYPSN